MLNDQEKELRIDSAITEKRFGSSTRSKATLLQYYKDLIQYFRPIPQNYVGDKDLTPDFTVVFQGPYEIVAK